MPLSFQPDNVNLGDLGNLDVTTPADGDTLVYDDATGTWTTGVKPDLSDDPAEALGTAAAGTGLEASRDDHVHPTSGSPAPPIGVACSDETTAISAIGTKATFRMPHAMTVTEVRANVNSACSTGTLTVDINDGGTTILSTKLTIDATEKTSTTATAAVISDSALADDAEITVDVDDVGDSTATGLKIWLTGTRA